MIRDCPTDDNNPLPAAAVQDLIDMRYGRAVKTMIIPDIVSVNYGRGVGYYVNEHEPPADVRSVSATWLRGRLKEGNPVWKEHIDPILWASVKEWYG